LKGKIEDGNSLQKSLTTHPGNEKLISRPVQQLLVSAEQSGNLSGTLMKISEIYEGKLNDSTKNLTVILEPILLVVVWLGVVAVAIAVILPLYSMIGNFNSVQ
jgi:type II secretory pathway component PulF